MKRILNLLLLFSCYSSFCQVFQEDFETVNPLYGTNVTNSNICPSISFKKSYNENIDCLSNWKTYKGTPAIEEENNCYFARENGQDCLNSFLSLWSIKSPTYANKVIGESAYINAYKLEPNTNYRLVYYVKASLTNPSSDTYFNIKLTSGLNPFYYTNSGQCGNEINVYGRTLENFNIPQNGISEWQLRTILFSIEGNELDTLIFYPSIWADSYSSTQLTVLLDNVSLFKEGECDPKTVVLKDKIISPRLITPIITAKRIYVTDVIVKPGGLLNLIGHTSIDLNDGFIVEEEGTFNAFIDGTCYPGRYGLVSEEPSDEVIISENSSDTSNEIVVYPNPSNDKFTVKSSQKIDELIIYNFLGEEVKADINKLDDSNIIVDLGKNEKGIYLVRLLSGKTWSDKKVIIN